MASLQGAAAARGPHVGLTPRQAGISAKKEAEGKKKAAVMAMRKERQEIKNDAKAKQAALLDRQRELIRERAESTQRQRKAAAAAKKAEKQREIAAKAKELKDKMKESREEQEHLLQEARLRRRCSIEFKEALMTWNRQKMDQEALEDAAVEETRVRQL